MGRQVFGLAAQLLGVATFALHDQLVSNWLLPGDGIFIAITGAMQIVGGAALFFARTAALGALMLAAVYLVCSLTLVPSIFGQPFVYASWGNVFYQLALVAGALIAYGMVMPSQPYAASLCRVAVVLFGLCNISYAIEQVEFLARTVSLVPGWMPPNGMFWAIATTVAFAAAGISLIIGYKSQLASRLLALMFMIFVVAIWIPILIGDPKTHSNWSEGIETFATGGVAWIVADYLRGASRSSFSSSATRERSASASM